MPDSIALKLENVSKKYTIGKSKDGSLRGTLGNLFKRKEEKEEEFWALKNISFEVKVGDVVGIIGKNGAGKSTLLKVLSQITKPTTGRIEINGRVASLLEVGTGFHPELTGRENIFLNGTILGMTRKEVQAKFDEIVSFSGVEKFIDTPVKHYSSGMYVRLAFAVAAHLEPEILIIDEVLSVGDAEFQKKCLGKMKDVAGEGRTVLFVSHQLSAVKSLCSKAILIRDGALHYQGNVIDTLQLYINSKENLVYTNKAPLTKQIYLKVAEIKKNNYRDDEDISLILNINLDLNNNSDNRLLIRLIDEYESIITSFEKELVKDFYTLKINKRTLKKGNYKFNIILYQPAVTIYDNVTCCNFNIINNIDSYSHLETFDTGKIYSDERWLE